MVVNGETEALTALIGATASANLGGFIATLGGFAGPTSVVQSGTTSSQGGVGTGDGTTTGVRNMTLQVTGGSRRMRMSSVYVLGVVGMVVVGIGWV